MRAKGKVNQLARNHTPPETSLIRNFFSQTLSMRSSFQQLFHQLVRETFFAVAVSNLAQFSILFDEILRHFHGSSRRRRFRKLFSRAQVN